VVFGSDQGLVGQFDEIVARFAANALADLPGKPQVWAVGERVHACLSEAGLTMRGLLPVPNSVRGIAPLVSQIQLATESSQSKVELDSVFVFHNRPLSGSLYEPVIQRLLPLDSQWRREISQVRWPTTKLPEVMGSDEITLRALIHEYLFISLFRACAESLASENASRLSAMERAETNINDVLADLHGKYHRLRQNKIDEELFDVISGFEALGGSQFHQ
jgi:F-type H+-transporting ATPase subunit gamma